jgi:hypothetical protein
VSENRLFAIVKATWRYLLPAALLLGAGYGAKVYFQEANVPVEKRRAAVADEVVYAAVARLSEHVGDYDGEGSPYPARAGWTPPSISCGEPVTLAPGAWSHPTWELLGIAPEGTTVYQYRFRRRGEDGFELLARTDSDCDGVYQVRRASGKTKWTGGLGKTVVSVDNPGE